MNRISVAVSGRQSLAPLFMDNLGPNPQADRRDFQKQSGSFLIPVLQTRLALAVISHGTEAFTESI